MKARQFGRFARLFGAAIVALTVAVSAGAAPARNAKAKAGDCAACHKAEKVLPAGHPATKAMKFDDCAKCHAPKSDKALTGKMSVGHLHLLKGVGCTQCHGSKKPAEVAMEKCASCHDTAKLVEATAGVKPKNPHTSPHYGKDADCSLCHRQHGKIGCFQWTKAFA